MTMNNLMIIPSDLQQFTKEGYLTSVSKSGADLDVEWRESPNKDTGRFDKKTGRPVSIEGIVIHSTDPKAGTRDPGTSAYNTFMNPASEVSAHYLIMEDGTIYQFVKDEDTAWHALGANPSYIGIEFAGYADDTKEKDYYFTDAQYRKAAKLVNHLLQKHNLGRDDMVSHEWIDKTLKVKPKEEWHHDPGDNFDWKRFYLELDKLEANSSLLVS